MGEYFSSESDEALARAAKTLKIACEEVGFFTITGHQVTPSLITEMFNLVRKFYALPVMDKQAILMDNPDCP